jgi:hypothetical protein
MINETTCVLTDSSTELTAYFLTMLCYIIFVCLILRIECKLDCLEIFKVLCVHLYSSRSRVKVTVTQCQWVRSSHNAAANICSCYIFAGVVALYYLWQYALDNRFSHWIDTSWEIQL